MAAKAEVRPATAMDSVNIVRLLKGQHAESAARLLAPFEDQKVLQYVTATLGNKYAFSIVAEASGRLIGSVAMSPIPLPWAGNVVVLGEAWFAVVPACRDKGIADRLLDTMGKMIDDVGVPAIHGTNLFAPEEFDDVLSKRPDLVIGRTTFVRVPKRKKEAA